MARHVPPYNIGDVVLTGRRGQGILTRAIELGERLRYGFRSPYTAYSHAALVIHADGTIAESQARGVQVDHISKYPPEDITVFPTGADLFERDQAQILNYVDSVLTHRNRYGVATVLGLALYCATGTGLCIQRAGSAICSGFVCDALTRAGYVWPRPPFAMLPADIAAALS
jgi:hypothetical protein